MNGPEVVLEAVNVRFRRGFGRTTVLRGADLNVEPGFLTVLVGPNGAGKTTVARLVVGTGRASAGRIRVGGGAPERYRRLEGLGYVPEEPRLPPSWTVVELLRYGSHLSRAPYRPDRAEELGLGPWLRTRVERLSRGATRRVALAWALTGDPALLVLDEPEGGLDPVVRATVWSTLRSVAREGRTVLLTSHDLPTVADRADRAHVVGDGRIGAALAGPGLTAEALESAVVAVGPP